MTVSQYVQSMCAEAGVVPVHVIGDVVRHRDGRVVQITGGRFWGEHGLSNFWYWREVAEDGTLRGVRESGYGRELGPPKFSPSRLADCGARLQRDTGSVVDAPSAVFINGSVS